MESITSFSGENRFLSNFYPCSVKLDGIMYSSSEHAYQAAKTLDKNVRIIFHKHPLPTAGQAKRLGRKLKLRPDWESVKFSVMEDLLRQKFSNDYLGKRLLETGDAELIEGNSHGDVFWGVTDKGGQNHLGKLLMKIREELKKE